MSSRTRSRLRTLEAAVLLCLSSIAIRIVPVRKLLPVDRPNGAAPASGPSEQTIAVRGAIRSAAARLPFEPTCLAQSLAAAAMLRLRRLPYRFHIGARMTKNFEAHAWVESEGLIVAGEGEVGSYSVLLTRER